MQNCVFCFVLLCFSETGFLYVALDVLEFFRYNLKFSHASPGKCPVYRISGKAVKIEAFTCRDKTKRHRKNKKVINLTSQFIVIPLKHEAMLNLHSFTLVLRQPLVQMSCSLQPSPVFSTSTAVVPGLKCRREPQDSYPSLPLAESDVLIDGLGKAKCLT